MNALQGTSKDQPASEGDATYWIYNVGCEELPQVGETEARTEV